MNQHILNEIKQTAHTFPQAYYKIVDKKRHFINRKYETNASLLWNGDYMIGKEKIQKFFLELPPSEHKILKLRAQPVYNATVDAILVIEARGTVKYLDTDIHLFQQFFSLTIEDNEWKILNDYYRFLEPVESSSDSDD